MDIVNQFVIIYGDFYGTVGLNTVLYRVYQVIAVKIPAASKVCGQELGFLE